MAIAEERILEEAPSPEEAVNREELARLAFWHWEMRGRPEDRSEEDWFWAEAELRRERNAEMVAEGHEQNPTPQMHPQIPVPEAV